MKATIAAAAAFVASAAAITPITVKGNAFYQGDTRFFIRGVDYQPGGASTPDDPIAVKETCDRDIPIFKQLGVNTVRIYSVDNTMDHDYCMQQFADAGIYLALDVNNGLYSINRADPEPSYNSVYLKNVFATIDKFAKYDNVLLFFSGNEVINDDTTTNCAPYVKAVTRDMKAYIAARGYRSIPVGYSAADVSQNRYQMAAYMNCGPEEVRSDFFSFNSYSWCDPSDIVTSGWQGFAQQYSNYSIPLFLSEYGCIKNPPREFQEVGALFGPVMTPVYSGGLVYEYTFEADNPGYGLVTVVSPSKVTPKNPDFTNYMKQLQQNPAPSGNAGAKTGLPPLSCPPQGPMWDAPPNELPTIPQPALNYIKNGAGGGYGLAGAGSQTAGVPSSGMGPLGPVGGGTSSDTNDGSSNSGVTVRPMDGALAALVISTLFGVAFF